MMCEKFKEDKIFLWINVSKMFGYDIDKDYLSKLEDEYLLKTEYESFISKLKKVESIKFKLLFLFLSTLISVISFGVWKLIDSTFIEYLNVMLYGLYGVLFLFVPLILIVQRYTILQEAKECVMKKIAQKDLK